MFELITQALKKSGYDCEPTEQNLINCFLDHVDSGVWYNLSIDDDLSDLTITDMAIALIRL